MTKEQANVYLDITYNDWWKSAGIPDGKLREDLVHLLIDLPNETSFSFSIGNLSPAVQVPLETSALFPIIKAFNDANDLTNHRLDKYEAELGHAIAAPGRSYYGGEPDYDNLQNVCKNASDDSYKWKLESLQSEVDSLRIEIEELKSKK